MPWSTSKSRGPVTASLVAVGLLLGLFAAGITYLSLSSERVRQYSVDVAVQEDGSALVRETIDYHFGSHHRHGIFRDISGYQLEDGDHVVSDVRAWSASAPADVTYPKSPDAVIQVGDEDRTVNGDHRYVLQYRITGVTDGAKLSFDAVGTGWNVPIDSADFHVTAPYRLKDVTCYSRSVSDGDPCGPVHATGETVTVHVEDLQPDQGVTIDGADAGPPDGPVRTGFAAGPELTDGRPFELTIMLVLGIGTLGYVLGAFLVVRWARRAGRDQAWTDAGPGPVADDAAEQWVTTWFEPPGDLTPAHGGVLLDETVQWQHRVAWLTQQALVGWIAIEDDGKRLRWLVPDNQWSEAPDPLQWMFGGRRVISLSGYDQRVAEGLRMVGQDLRRWRATSPLWDHEAERRNRSIATTIMTCGGMLSVLGVLGLMWTAGTLPVVAYLAAGASAVMAGATAGAWRSLGELAVRTPQGFTYRQQVEGFRRFLVTSKGEHAREAADRHELRRFTAWAVALGELRPWNAALTAATLPRDTAGLYEFANFYLLGTAVQAATTRSSGTYGGSGHSFGDSGMSGSGFSSSGGSGGGGGGGGSW